MSDKEKDLLERLAKLPPDVREKFLLLAQGAAMAVESIEEKPAEESAEKAG